MSEITACGKLFQTAGAECRKTRPMGGARLFLLGGKGQGMWGQILAMEGLLMDAWTITGGGGKARARGAAAPLALCYNRPWHDQRMRV